MKVVIDSNVLIAANGRATHATPACVASCAEYLLLAVNQFVILDDVERSIFEEYKRYCNFDGQPGPGDFFFAQYVRSIGSPGKFESVSISGRSVPASLSSLDPSDVKFLLVYLVGVADKLVNATDSDWSHLDPALRAEGVDVEELCPGLLKAVKEGGGAK